MIQANELRIGNLISGVSDRIETVVGLSQNVAYVYVGKIPETFRERLEDANGIPLTEEWLIKLGFNKMNDLDSWYSIPVNNTWTTINACAKHSMFEVFINHHSCVIKRQNSGKVHQLQNLYFSLTGQELQLTQ